MITTALSCTVSKIEWALAVLSVFWLFWLSCHYLPSDWLERLLWGSLTVLKGSSPESPCRRVLMIFLVQRIGSLFYYVSVASCPYVIYFPTPMARYSLFVLKMHIPLNTKQTIWNKPSKLWLGSTEDTARTVTGSWTYSLTLHHFSI